MFLIFHVCSPLCSVCELVPSLLTKSIIQLYVFLEPPSVPWKKTVAMTTAFLRIYQYMDEDVCRCKHSECSDVNMLSFDELGQFMHAVSKSTD